ncbi:putative invertase inhibitor [Aristolochia californica]|uniref:putative invertase inhibitor n=1 Tax=Aristolochia californica TaxID=171875 RepID=UPI0035D8F72D
MVTSFRFLLLLLLLALLQVGLPTVVVFAEAANPQNSSDLVADICGNVAKHTFCIQALKADGRTATADLPRLGLIANDLLKWNASATRKYIGDMLAVGRCSATRDRLSSCAGQYNEVLSLAGSCYDYLKNKQYDQMKAAANSAISDAYNCELLFRGELCHPSPFTVQNDNAENLGDIVASVAAFLRRP